jgi:hypothetical protein
MSDAVTLPTPTISSAGINTNAVREQIPMPADLHLNKLAAAQRQLRSAIRLYFAGEDELAVHTVAAAAYRVLVDLKAERGMDEAADSYLTSIFYAIRDYRRGTLPSDLKGSSDFMAWVEEAANQIPIHEDTKFEDISVRLSPETARDFWQRRNRVAKLLKHADRDPKSTIRLDEVDNLCLLLACCSAYLDIAKSLLGNEGFVFNIYVAASSPTPPSTDGTAVDLHQKLAQLDEGDRRRFCAKAVAFPTKINIR